MVVGGYMTQKEQNAWFRQTQRGGQYPDEEHQRAQEKGGESDPKSKYYKGGSSAFTEGEGGQWYQKRYGGKLGTRMAHFGVSQVLEPIALAATQRAIQGIQKKKRGGGVSREVREAAEHRLALAITGTIPKKRRGGKIGENLGKFVVSDVVEPVLDASAQRAVQGISGGGRRRGGKIGENLGKFVVSDVVEPVLDASAQRAVQGISGGAICAHCGHGGRHPIKTIEHHYAPMVGGYVANGDYVLPPKSQKQQRDDATFEKSRQGMYGGWAPRTPEQLERNAENADAHGWGIPGTINDTFTSSSAERKAGRHEQKYGVGFPKGSPEALAAMKAARAKQPRQGRFVKGSQEAKDAMAALRARRKTA